MRQLEVGKNGAVFGNDQDDLGGGFSRAQAFEGDFFELRMFDKMLDPDQFDDNADSLVYFLSPNNIAN